MIGTRTLLCIFGVVISATIFAQPPDAMWMRSFEGGRPGEMLQIDANNYLLTGTTSTDSGGVQFWIQAVTSNGDSLWSHTIGDSHVGLYYQCGDKLSNGDILICGYAYADTLQDYKVIARVTPSGELIWSHADIAYLAAYDALASPEGGAYLSGVVRVNGSFDSGLQKIDSVGNIEWTRSYGDTTRTERAEEIIRTHDGGFLLSGFASGDQGSEAGVVVKLDANADSVWSVYTDSTIILSTTETNDGFLLFGGKSFPYSPIHGMKIDLQGNTQWFHVYHGNDWFPISNEIAIGSGYALLCMSSTFDQPKLMRLDDEGDTLWTICCWGGDNRYNQLYSIFQLSDGSYLMGGRWSDFVSDHQGSWLTRTTPDPLASPENPQPIATDFALYQNYPNPFNPATTISFDIPRATHTTVKVFDLTGREVRTLLNETLTAGTHDVTFDARDLPSGIYFYRLSADGFDDTRKMILLK